MLIVSRNSVIIHLNNFAMRVLTSNNLLDKIRRASEYEKELKKLTKNDVRLLEEISKYTLSIIHFWNVMILPTDFYRGPEPVDEKDLCSELQLIINTTKSLGMSILNDKEKY